MFLRILRPLALSALVVAAIGVEASAQTRDPIRRVHPQYDLFYNNYTNGPATPAQMYVSPLPAPEWVGHTYVTYQPLMPQAWLNPHSRRYVRYAPGHPIVPVNYTRVSFW